MNELLLILTKHGGKGRDSLRVLMLAALVYMGKQVADVDKRLAVVESRISAVAVTHREPSTVNTNEIYARSP